MVRQAGAAFLHLSQLLFCFEHLGFNIRRCLMRLKDISSRYASWIAAVSFMCFVGTSGAATINSWSVAGGGSWNVPTNWTPANVPTATEAATFPAALPAATNVITLDANQTAYAVNFAAASGAKIVNINAGTPAGVLTLLSTDAASDGLSTFQAISATSSIGTINAPIQLGSGSNPGPHTATFNASQNTSNSLIIAGGVSEAAGETWGLRITGSGGTNAIVNVQTAAMTYSGDTTIANNGILRLLTAEMLPNGTGKGNVVLEGNGILRGQGNPGGFGSETINALISISATSQVNLNQNNTRTLIVGDGNANGDYAGQLTESTGTFAFTKIGTGTQALSGTSNGSGVYTVSAGTLLVNGSHTPRQANANGYTVAAGATLGGTGSINQSGAGASTGAVAINGTLAPGASAGSLDIARTLNLNNNSAYNIELGGSTPGDVVGSYDQVNMTLATGAVNLTGTVNLGLSLINGFAPSASDVFYILTRADAGSYTTLFNGTSEGGTVVLSGGYTGKITYLANWTGSQGTSSLTGGNDVAIYEVIPEPSTIALTIGLAAIAAGTAVRSRRRTIS
jgi:autotransporter-associated beta strand protein